MSRDEQRFIITNIKTDYPCHNTKDRLLAKEIGVGEQKINHMSAGEFLRRGLRFIIKGIPNNVVTVGISYTQPNGRLRDQRL